MMVIIKRNKQHLTCNDYEQSFNTVKHETIIEYLEKLNIDGKDIGIA